MIKKILIKHRLLVGVFAGIVASIFVIFISSNLFIFEDFELRSLDYRFYARGSVNPQRSADTKAVFENIVIIDIDEESLDKLGGFRQAVTELEFKYPTVFKK